jgi:hypothetical protein
MRALSAGDENAPSLPESGVLVAAPRLVTAAFRVEAEPADSSLQVEYSLKGGRLSMRFVPAAEGEPDACDVALSGVRAVNLDGKPVDVREDGSACFRASPRSVISAEAR